MIYLGREGCAAPFARRVQELVSSHVDLNFMDKLVLGGKLVNTEQPPCIVCCDSATSRGTIV